MQGPHARRQGPLAQAEAGEGARVPPADALRRAKPEAAIAPLGDEADPILEEPLAGGPGRHLFVLEAGDAAAPGGEPEASVTRLVDGRHHLVRQSLRRAIGGEGRILEPMEPAAVRADPEVALGVLEQAHHQAVGQPMRCIRLRALAMRDPERPVPLAADPEGTGRPRGARRRVRPAGSPRAPAARCPPGAGTRRPPRCPPTALHPGRKPARGRHRGRALHGEWLRPAVPSHRCRPAALPGPDGALGVLGQRPHGLLASPSRAVQAREVIARELEQLAQLGGDPEAPIAGGQQVDEASEGPAPGRRTAEKTPCFMRVSPRSVPIQRVPSWPSARRRTVGSASSGCSSRQRR